MNDHSRFRTTLGLSVLVLLALLCAGCNLEKTIKTPTPTAEATEPEGPVILTGPEGMELTLEGEAANQAPFINMEVLSESGPSLAMTPFQAVSPVYRLMMDSQPFAGGMQLAVPFNGAGSDPGGRRMRYAVLVLSEASSPVLVGAQEEPGKLRFPVVGAGRYQVLAVAELDPSLVALEMIKPLSVPSYPQMTSSWCSTTAMTDLAGYHEGAWPSGGLGSVWGESANWYLAGLGGQAYNRGYFFHWLLGAGGYTVPEDVKQSFTDGNAEVIIWDWRSLQIQDSEWGGSSEFEIYSNIHTGMDQAITRGYANALFDFFKSYVENQVWGQLGDRRPVAWGSSLAGHSRIITGSDGTSFYFNNPSSGSWNDIKAWDAYKQEVLDSLVAEEQEVIDTVVFYAPVRPPEDRRAVLWLWQADENQPGSIVFKRGTQATTVARWLWDGDFGHQYGYFYNDLVGDQPFDPVFQMSFKPTSPQDMIEYSFSVRSISEGSYDYEVQTRLYDVPGGNQLYYGEKAASVGTGERKDFFPAGTIQVGSLPEGLYYLKFTLMMGGVTEDVKYVYFQMAKHDPYVLNIGRLKMSSYCRKGPGTNFDIATPLNAGQEATLLALNPEMTWGQFDVLVNSVPVRCWVSMDRVEMAEIPEVPIVTVVPPERAVVCSDYKTAEDCRLHSDKCTWSVGAFGPGVCKNK